MFSMYIVWYLFFAGAGSGAYTIAALFYFFGRHATRDDLREYRVISQGGFWLGPLLVAFGVIFLVFDLGVPENAFKIFLASRISLLGFGSWSLLLFCLLACASLFLHGIERVAVAKPVLRTIEALTLLAALAVLIYTGVFVSSMQAVPFLHSPLIVVLFIVSSLACGAAVITLYGFFNQQRKSMRYGLRVITRIDLFLILLEVITLTALFIQKYLESDIAALSLYNIVFGEGFPAFWLGVILLGMVLPLVFSIVAKRTPQPLSAATWAVDATAILVSGFALRYCLIVGSLHVATPPVL